MRWLGLYLRSRRVPAAGAAAGAITVVCWSLWALDSDSRDVGAPMVILTVLLLVSALATTLAGPDDALERSASMPWPARRTAHLFLALALVLLLLLLTLPTAARFGPAGLVVRDAAGLLGLTALGATVLGAHRSWFLPLGWTLVAIVGPGLVPLPDTVLVRVLTWQSQDPGSHPAAGAAGLLAAAGVVAYGTAGSARRAPAEAAL